MAKNAITWDGVMDIALKMPGIKVDRNEYLVKAFSAYGDVSGLKLKRPVDVFDDKLVSVLNNTALFFYFFMIVFLSNIIMSNI